MQEAEKKKKFKEETEVDDINNRNEMEFINIVFPDNLKMLHNPCIFIAETAATVHTTSQLTGILPDVDQKWRHLSLKIMV